ncbi:MAG: nucleotidyltransferase domain-containing protein [Nanoarchaeota archaeon]|nr:nucleotidyltransferase domain-containing protein [Nanoarchaeota archaeon]
MKNIEQLKLKDNERVALQELKRRLLERFKKAEIILYGSKARGDYDRESDIDLLILIDEEINTALEDEIISLAYDIELLYDVVFGLLIESKRDWNSEIFRAMPIHWNVNREGVLI